VSSGSGPFAQSIMNGALVDPSHSHCAGWDIPGKNDSGSIWGLVGAVGLWAAWIGYLAIKWDWVARWTVERIERDGRLAESGTGAGRTCALTNFRIGRARARVFYTHIIATIVALRGWPDEKALSALRVIKGRLGKDYNVYFPQSLRP